jgi:hypothetical protein
MQETKHSVSIYGWVVPITSENHGRLTDLSGSFKGKSRARSVITTRNGSANWPFCRNSPWTGTPARASGMPSSKRGTPSPTRTSPTSTTSSKGQAVARVRSRWGTNPFISGPFLAAFSQRVPSVPRWDSLRKRAFLKWIRLDDQAGPIDF